GESSLWVHNAHHRLGVPYGNSLVAGSYRGEGERGRERGRDVWPERQFGNGWQTFGNRTRGFSAPEPRRPSAPYRSASNQSFQRDTRTDTRTKREDNGRTFGRGRQTASAQFGRTFSQPLRTPERTSDRGFQTNR